MKLVHFPLSTGSLMSQSVQTTIRDHNEAERPNQEQCNRTANLAGMSGKFCLIRTTNILAIVLVDAKCQHQERSSRKVLCNLLCKNTKLIRLVYLFRSKRVFAFVAFIPILPTQGALEDELPRNTKF